MRITLVVVGKLRPALREVADDYLRRIGRGFPIVEREVRESGHRPTVALRQEEEDRSILRVIPQGIPVTLLDPVGTMRTSEALSESMSAWRISARDRALVIGGADGVGGLIRARASDTWSLGPMTLPHELARIVVLEQLYRGLTILQGTPYHRGSA